MENIKENVPPIPRPAKMTSELFSALFEVQDDSEPLCLRRGPVKDVGVVEVVDLTTSCPLTGGVQQEPVLLLPTSPSTSLPRSMPSATPSEFPSSSSAVSDFCSRCLISLKHLNFLAKLTHVKSCGGKVVDGEHAVGRFLEYYGYEELQQHFKKNRIDMDVLVATDVGVIEEITGVKGLGGWTKFELALEQYRKRGHLHVRNSIIGGRTAGGSGSSVASKRKEQTERSVIWARSKTVVSQIQQHTMSELRRKHLNLARNSYSLDKVLLGSLWIRPKHTARKRINLTTCSTLWVAAGACESNHIGIEERLRLTKEARMSTQTRERLEAQGNQAQQQATSSSLATKRMRLRALQDELTVQKQTVRELQGMISELQDEIDEEQTKVGSAEVQTT